MALPTASALVFERKAASFVPDAARSVSWDTRGARRKHRTLRGRRLRTDRMDPSSRSCVTATCGFAIGRRSRTTAFDLWATTAPRVLRRRATGSAESGDAHRTARSRRAARATSGHPGSTYRDELESAGQCAGPIPGEEPRSVRLGVVNAAETDADDPLARPGRHRRPSPSSAIAGRRDGSAPGGPARTSTSRRAGSFPIDIPHSGDAHRDGARGRRRSTSPRTGKRSGHRTVRGVYFLSDRDDDYHIYHVASNRGARRRPGSRNGRPTPSPELHGDRRTRSTTSPTRRRPEERHLFRIGLDGGEAAESVS